MQLKVCFNQFDTVMSAQKDSEVIQESKIKLKKVRKKITIKIQKKKTRQESL